MTQIHVLGKYHPKHIFPMQMKPHIQEIIVSSSVNLITMDKEVQVLSI